MPTGTLAATSLPESLVACAIALVVYFLFRRNLFVGIVVKAISKPALREIWASQGSETTTMTPEQIATLRKWR
jgi:hypothetical protein